MSKAEARIFDNTILRADKLVANAREWPLKGGHRLKLLISIKVRQIDDWRSRK